MGVDTSRQLNLLLLSFSAGLAGGLFYELLRPLRRGAGKGVSALLDCLFCLGMGFAAFIFALSQPPGRLGIWELSAMLLGFLAWIYGPGDFFYPRFCAFFHRLAALFAKFGKITKKSSETAKIVFKKSR